MNQLEEDDSSQDGLRYICHKCLETFEDRDELTSHIWSEHKERFFRGPRCQRSPKRSDPLGQNLLFGHGQAGDEAHDPGLLRKPKIESPTSRARPESFTSCNVCFVELANKKKLLTHMWTVHQIKSFVCDICSKSFHCQKNLSQHLRVVHCIGPKGPTTPRPRVSTTPRPKGLMTSATPALKSTTSLADIKKQSDECSTQAIVDRIEKLQRQIRSKLMASLQSIENGSTISRSSSNSSLPDGAEVNLEAGEIAPKPGPSSKRKKFPTVKPVNFSVVLPETGPVPTPIKDDLPDPDILSTGFSLATTSTLEIFAKLIGPVRPQELKSPRAKKQYLWDRVKVATRTRFKSSCHICGVEFPTLRLILDHMWMTHREKHYPCEICLKWFGNYKQLFEHISLVHCSEKKFNCNFCHYAFIQNHRLQRHMKTVHKEFEI